MESQKYFQQYDYYFWSLTSYVANSDVAEYDMPFGGIIAYSEYVVEILEHLSEQSWPPFGSLLLAIIATNHNASADLEAIYKFGKSKEKASSFPNGNLFRVGASVDFLKLLASLPAEYKTGNKRLLLFQTIFDNCHNRVSREKTKLFLDEYKFADENLFVKNPFNDANFTKDFRTIALLKTKFPTVNSIIQAMENLPEQKIEFEEEELQQEKVSEKPKDFVSQLIEENKTFQVGSLIKRIWSGLNIPLHHNTPSKQPLGGISDLTNKGDFDKLLISEFANDDLIFMSRLANNEALYIQREIPPEDNKFKRILLIDSSLKNWGNPKIVNFATALAIAKHPKTDIECQLHILGESHEKVEIKTVNDVIEGLNILSGKLDCSQGLASYFEHAKGLAEANENFLILSEDSLKSVAMQKVIHENFDQLKYLITTNESGEIIIYKIKNKGKKHIKTIFLSLLDLWQQKKIKNVADSTIEDTFPILYPVAQNYTTIFYHDALFYMVSRGKLYQFIDVSKGLLKIADDIPFTSGSYAIFVSEKKEMILVNVTDDEIQQYNLKTKKQYCVPILRIRDSIKPTLFVDKNSLYFKNSIGFYKIDSESIDPRPDHEIGAIFEKYVNTMNIFKRQYSHSKHNFNIIYKMENIWINETQKYIDFNNYGLFNNELKSLEYMQNHNFLSFETYVDLIFKNKGNFPLKTAKFLKENLNISLLEAKNIVDGELEKVLENVIKEVAEDLKYQIEDLGAVCYTKIKCHKMSDGSKITCRDGIAILESSNKSIPTIFIPMVIKGMTAFATQHEFAGNEYFLPKENSLTVISVKDFNQKYITPFINTILEHEARVKTS